MARSICAEKNRLNDVAVILKLELCDGFIEDQSGLLHRSVSLHSFHDQWFSSSK
jgi:hypothetical protein